MRLGEWLKSYRKNNRMTMQDLADACGFSKAYIGALEKGVNPSTGKPYSPTIQTLTKIAQGTGQDLDSLLKVLDGDQPITISPLNTLDGEEMKLVDSYRILDTEDKNFLWNVIQRLLISNKGIKAKGSIINNNGGSNYGVVGGNFNAGVTIG